MSTDEALDVRTDWCTVDIEDYKVEITCLMEIGPPTVTDVFQDKTPIVTGNDKLVEIMEEKSSSPGSSNSVWSGWL